jgi:alkanesulfonate monooxygenase SsuD/methylene tetrahydromethanopterin reductase-like flavin-dependent oxidoreductase (luciferase family)
VQPGGPEILAGSLLPAAIRRAARFADGLCGFSFGPDPTEVATAFDVAREAWAAQGRKPRLVTSCWYALGDVARAQMDDYVARYLATFGPDLAAGMAPLCTTTSASTLRAVVPADRRHGRRRAAAGPDDIGPRRGRSRGRPGRLSA